MKIKVVVDVIARNEEELGTAMGEVYRAAKALMKAHEKTGASPYNDDLTRDLWLDPVDGRRRGNDGKVVN